MGPLAVSKANHPQLIGNGELDTVVSSRGKSKGCLATFVERQTRFYVAVKIKNRSASEMDLAISESYELCTSQ